MTNIRRSQNILNLHKTNIINENDQVVQVLKRNKYRKKSLLLERRVVAAATKEKISIKKMITEKIIRNQILRNKKLRK